MFFKISDYIYAYSNVEREAQTFLGSSAKKKLWGKHGNQPNLTKSINLCENDLVAPMVIASFKKIPRSFQARCHGTAGTAHLWRFCVMIGELSKEKCLSKRRKQMLKVKSFFYHLESFEKENGFWKWLKWKRNKMIMIPIMCLLYRSSTEKWIEWNSNHRPLPRLKHLHSAPTQHKWNPVQHSIDHHCLCLSCWGVLELRGHASLKDLPSFIKMKTVNG